MGTSTSAKRIHPPSNQHDELVPDARARKECGGVSRMTFYRWERNPDLQFPLAVIINGRKYRPRSELDQFIKRRKDSRLLTRGR
jgi:predicted DNA-binding transcriptional regulator AlpA